MYLGLNDALRVVAVAPQRAAMMTSGEPAVSYNVVRLEHCCYAWVAVAVRDLPEPSAAGQHIYRCILPMILEKRRCLEACGSGDDADSRHLVSAQDSPAAYGIGRRNGPVYEWSGAQ
jgi:hypothetical protein